MSTLSYTIDLGPRFLLALVGAATLVGGVWFADRAWDERGSKAYERAKKDGVALKQKDIDAAFPFPFAFIIGWALYAAAYLYPLHGTDMVVTQPGLFAAGFSMALSIIASLPMAYAVKNRKATMKKVLGLCFVVSWLLLTIATTKSAGGGIEHALPCALGAISIIASMKILWKYRKMGDSWEQDGVPNPSPVVYNMGGPLFVWGWFLYLVGMAGTPSYDGAAATVSASGLVIALNLRTAIAFVAGCGMVPIVMIIDYAHDEGSPYLGFGRGTNGKFFGRFLESPLPFILAWFGFGFANLLTASGDLVLDEPLRWVILANCVLQAIDAGVLIQSALYEVDMHRKNKWSVPFVMLFMALAYNVGKSAGGNAIYLSLPGALMIIAGQKTVFGDRKRGDYFMQNGGKTNPNPIVYSVGEPLFMTGWILISLAMSIAV